MLIWIVPNAYAIAIDGIQYSLIPKAKIAEVITSVDNNPEEIIIPQTVSFENVEYTVTTIWDAAFASKKKLKTVILPKVMTSIGNSSFSGCSALTTIIMPETLNVIGENAFKNCSKLQSIEIPQGLSVIESGAFDGCLSLNAVHIKDIKSWCNITFSYYDSNPLSYAKKLYINNEEITDLVIPDEIIAINAYAFNSFENLKSVTLPIGLLKIGYSAFNGCKSLIAVHISDISAWCNIDFSYPQWSNPLHYAHHLYLNGNEINNLDIPYGITSIHDYTFSNCYGVSTISLPSSISSIGAESFYNCLSLNNINIPNSVIFIDTDAFYCSQKVKEIVLGSGINKINSHVFRKCQQITDVYCYNVDVPQTQADVFEDSYIEYATLHIPGESIELYKANEPWKKFGNIVPLTDSDPKPTGIMSIETEDEKGFLYDLNGRRVEQPLKGLYIKNGKKYVVK